MSGLGRVEVDRAAVVDAVLDTIAHQGYTGLTVQEVAARAGVDTAAIYRAWPSKAELVLDVALEAVRDHIGDTDTGNLRGDLIAYVTGYADAYTGALGQAATEVIASYPDSPGLAAVFTRHRDFLQGRLDTIAARAADRGELAPDAPVDLVGETIRALITYRLIVTRRPTGEPQARDLVDRALLPLLSPRPPHTR